MTLKDKLAAFWRDFYAPDLPSTFGAGEEEPRQIPNPRGFTLWPQGTFPEPELTVRPMSCDPTDVPELRDWDRIQIGDDTGVDPY